VSVASDAEPVTTKSAEESNLPLSDGSVKTTDFDAPGVKAV
jgi:hypothetical protein